MIFLAADKRSMVLHVMRDARHSSSGWSRVNCPFCPRLLGKVDRKQALAVNMGNGCFVCFRCGTTGRLHDDEYQRQEVAPDTAAFSMNAPDGYLALCEEPARSALSAGPARQYLRSRKLTQESIWKEARIGACLSGRYEGRVIVPVLSSNNDWIGWVGRIWVKQADRAYSYPRGMKRGDILYNHAALLRETDAPVLVVEGVFDALAYWPDAVAVLGKPSDTQVYALASARRPVAVVLDGDAWQEGEVLAMKLRLEGQRAGSVKLGPREDPDEVPHGWLRERAVQCLEE